AGERVEERRLAGVGIAHDRHREHVAARARTALHPSSLAQALELVLEHAHALVDVAPVELDLLLARAARLAQAAALALKVRPAAHHRVTRHACAFHQALDLFYAFVVALVAQVETNDDRGARIGELGEGFRLPCGQTTPLPSPLRD